MTFTFVPYNIHTSNRMLFVHTIQVDYTQNIHTTYGAIHKSFGLIEYDFRAEVSQSDLITISRTSTTKSS
jgi:hypothetical protein